MSRSRWAWVVLATAVLAAAGCRCGKSLPGEVGKAAAALDAIPADVDALVVFDVEGLRRGSLGDLVYRPWVVRAFREWGGAPCESLAASAVRSAALGVRLPRGGVGGSRRFFLATEGPTIDAVRACLDAHGSREGLASSFEEIAGGRGITDGRGFHALASGQNVVTIAFPFNRVDVLAEAVPVAFGRKPSVSSAGTFREILDRAGGDLIVAFSETRDLFREYGTGMRDRVAAAFPADMCDSAADVRSYVQAARLVGFGDLAGTAAAIDAWFGGMERICAADAVRAVFDAAGTLRAGALGVSGRDDIVLSLVLVFADERVAGLLRGVFADAVHVVGAAPARLDLLERLPLVAGKVDLSSARAILRNPVLKHLSVGGDGVVFEFGIRIEAADARATVESLQKFAQGFVAR